MSKVRVERDGALAQIVLDSPPLNLFDAELITDLAAAVREVAADPPRAVLVRAEGRAFTGGVDVNVFHGLSVDRSQEVFEELVSIVHGLEDLPVPTIAAVGGLCLTAGFELSLGCDLILAGESARFGLVEIVVGLTPAMGGTQRVAERAGPARARELVMTGELFDAATLERWNVVNRIVPDAELDGVALALANRLANGPTCANGATKQMVRAFLDHGVRGADARIGEIASPLFDTEDLQRAVETFLAEGPGKAAFEGR